MRHSCRLCPGQEGTRNCLPLLPEFPLSRLLAGSTIPIAGVREIAFASVQVSVHPGAVGTLVGLRAFMRLGPITLGVPPERPKRMAQGRRRCFERQRSLEVYEFHARLQPVIF